METGAEANIGNLDEMEDRVSQKRNKWPIEGKAIQVEDVVLLDVELFQRAWPLAKVVKTYPGKDGIVRVVDVLCKEKTYRRPTHILVQLETDLDAVESLMDSPGENVQASQA